MKTKINTRVCKSQPHVETGFNVEVKLYPQLNDPQQTAFLDALVEFLEEHGLFAAGILNETDCEVFITRDAADSDEPCGEKERLEMIKWLRGSVHVERFTVGELEERECDCEQESKQKKARRAAR